MSANDDGRFAVTPTSVPRRARVQVHELEATGQTVLHDPAQGRFVALNEVGAAIWYLADGIRAIDDIVDEIVTMKPRDRGLVLDDVSQFVQELGAMGLLELD